MNTVKFILTLEVEIDPQGTSLLELDHNLRQVVRDAVNNGTLTGETPATVEHYTYSLEKI